MNGGVPDRIRFGAYSGRVPAGMAEAVRRATDRFVLGRIERAAELPHWEELRTAASEIRLHTIEHLDAHLARLEEKVAAAGGKVHWAATAGDARRIVLEIAKEHGVRTVVKSKSMATEEIGLNRALAEAGIEALETDLGEYIIQLAGTGPSHIVVPAVHLKKEDIAALFREKLHIDAPADPAALTDIARRILREKFLRAGMGVTGGNFLIAESGTLVILTNEGNGRMCTTAPKVHTAVVGIDKLIPDWESLTVFLKLLPRSATGQKLTAYTQFITGPRRAGDDGGANEFHLVLLDNGRSRILRDPVGREVFRCVRCGACLNICPVYRSVGGFAYGWFISGPIGAMFSPQMLGTRAARELPFACSLCGACAEACPVKIPIPDILRHLRRRVAEGDSFERASAPAPIRCGAVLASFALGWDWLYRLGTRLLPAAMAVFRRGDWIPAAPWPLSRWTKVRPLPPFTAAFRRWWPHRKDSGR